MVFLTQTLRFAMGVPRNLPLNKTLTAGLERYSAFNPSPLSLEMMIKFGEKQEEKHSFVFLRKELPVRLANIIKELDLLPDVVKNTKADRLLEEWYHKTFEEILEFEHLNSEDPKVVEDFTNVLANVHRRHANVLQTIAEAVLEAKNSHGFDHVEDRNIQYFLDRFLINRISIRMLINQHNILFGSEELTELHPNHIGSIDPACDVVAVLKDAMENAQFLCDYHYSASPEVELFTHNSLNPNEPVRIPYVPSHLYHILFELLKNAMRAVVEEHGDDLDEELPPIQVMVVMGKEDVTINIADQGGGIPRSMLDRPFHYLFSTAPHPSTDGASGQAPLAGYGFGLPLSRLFARYFQGDLVLNSIEGYGTNAVVFLKTLSTDANELLPIFNKTSYKQYKKGPQNPDWSSAVPGSLGKREL